MQTLRRRVRRSREMRAMAHRTAYGGELLAGQWAGAEFAALARLWADGVAVPYPVQVSGTGLLLEFIADARRRRPASPGWARALPSCVISGTSWSARCSAWPGTA